MRYKTKTIEVEAYEFTGTVASAENLVARYRNAIFMGQDGVGRYDGRLIVQTPGGPVNVTAGEFIVEEPGGALTIHNHITFNQKYERVVMPAAVEAGS